MTSEHVARAHASDAVFDRLAAIVCGGEVGVGSPLPPERALAERFGVSRPVVRQATHRLALLGLVRVRQGGATVVVDPATITHPEAAAVRVRFGGPEALHELHQRQIVSPLGLLVLAERHASPEDAATLSGVIDRLEAGLALADFEEAFWMGVAELSRSRLLVAEMAYWFRGLREVPALRHPELGDLSARVAVYREVVRRLGERADASAFWLQVARIGLERLEAGRAPSSR